jgi:hypothetical protein
LFTFSRKVSNLLSQQGIHLDSTWMEHCKATQTTNHWVS